MTFAELALLQSRIWYIMWRITLLCTFFLFSPTKYCFCLQKGFFDKRGTKQAYILPGKWRAWNECVEHLRRLKTAILAGFVCFSFVNMLFFCLSAFAHKQVQARRGIYDCGHESATTARSARSRHWERHEFDCFYSLSFLVESKVSLSSC